MFEQQYEAEIAEYQASQFNQHDTFVSNTEPHKSNRRDVSRREKSRQKKQSNDRLDHYEDRWN